jgi:aquaporin Z
MKKLIIEFIGTFFLVLVIGMTTYQQTLLSSPQFLAPLAIGTVLIALIYMGGPVSGAHYNPAVTLGILMRKKISGGDAVKYIGAQLLGAIGAAVVFYIIFKSAMAPVSYNPGFSSNMKPLMIELLFTFILVLVILNMYIPTKASGSSYYGLAIGVTVIACILATGPLSGGALNPASTLGPMFIDAATGGSSLNNAWFYLVGQFAGGALAAVVYGMTNPEGN